MSYCQTFIFSVRGIYDYLGSEKLNLRAVSKQVHNYNISGETIIIAFIIITIGNNIFHIGLWWRQIYFWLDLP